MRSHTKFQVEDIERLARELEAMPPFSPSKVTKAEAVRRVLPHQGIRRGGAAHRPEEEGHPSRTFNDLARLANVEAIVTKSISGHKTERMREHYSSVQPSEQRESIGRVLRPVQGGANDSDDQREGRG